MASILDRYGIKEVADVTFYDIDSNGNRSNPVLYLDTLKVSTIEQTAEQSDARGGKGNPKLITWDYGKDITVTLEDALFSSKSLAIMFGNGKPEIKSGDDIVRTVVVRVGTDKHLPDHFVADIYDSNVGSARKKIYMGTNSTVPSDMIAFSKSGVTLVSLAKEDGTIIQPNGTDDYFTSEEWNSLELTAGEKAFITYSVKATTRTVSISGDSFPGTYYVTGDTYARSDVDGKDQFFQFIIPKAKVTSENTITLEAEGDPSVFSMNLQVLRPEDGEMMRLVQYDLDNPTV